MKGSVGTLNDACKLYKREKMCLTLTSTFITELLHETYSHNAVADIAALQQLYVSKS